MGWAYIANGAFTQCSRIKPKLSDGHQKDPTFSRAINAATRLTRFSAPGSRHINLQIQIVLPPRRRNPRHPIFSAHGFASEHAFFSRQNPGRRFKLRPSDFSADAAGCNPHFGIVSYPLALAGAGLTHHVQLAVFLAKPHRRINCHAIVAECRQGNIFLPFNFARNRHTKLYAKQPLFLGV
jgi:hypothetical protein